MDLLVAVVLAICPTPGSPSLTECHEYFLNCAVKRDASIDAESIKKCANKYSQER